MEFKRPVLLLDKEKCLANIHKMKARADHYSVDFRPHFKTHQSAQVGEWLRKAGVSKITVSSVMMAEYFAGRGWDDITIAFPVNIAETDEINRLAKRVNLNVLVENPESLAGLTKKITCPVGVFIKLDAGYHRTGIPIEDNQQVLDLISSVSRFNHLVFKGFIIHNGHTYSAKGKTEIRAIHELALGKIRVLKQILDKNQISAMFSIGDTPTMSVVENYELIDEIRPGNFVFYDAMQQNLGSCTFDQIAVALAVPVVAKHPERQEIVVYGGAVHLSKDSFFDQSGNQVFGRVVRLNEMGWSEPFDDTFVKSLSQEHGIIKAGGEVFEKIRIGDFIGILPVHSCLTVSLMREYFTLQGDRITTMLSCF